MTTYRFTLTVEGDGPPEEVWEEFLFSARFHLEGYDVPRPEYDKVVIVVRSDVKIEG